MTKKGYMPKLLAVLVGAILCLCAATVALTFKSTSAHAAEGDELPPMVLEEIDEFSTVGYKIEATPSAKWTNPADSTEYTYDYKFTIAKGNYIILNSGSKLFKVNNADDLVFNVSTSTGVDVTNDCAVSTSRWTITSTDIYNTSDDYTSGLKAQKRQAPSIGLIIGNQDIERTFYTEASVDTTCDGPDEGCTGTHTIKGVLRLLVEIVDVKDYEFAFTGAKADENDDKTGVWLTFGADVLGVAKADETWSHAERWSENAEGCFLNANKYFFEKIYFLEDYDVKAGAPTEQQLQGRDLYTLMKGDNLAVGKTVFQTEVRYDHIELHKRAWDADEASWGRVNYETGDAFYLAEGLMMLGKDGNGNWAAAQEGGSKNVLKAAQFYYYDADLGWSIDQYDMGVSVDKKTALVEIGQTATVTANVVTGAFLQGGDVAVTWSSSDEAIATVANGVVTGVATGEATITAAIANGSAATCKVTVVRNDQVEKVELNKKTVTLYTTGTEEETSTTLVATVTGGSALTKVVTWSSSNESVATVDQNGKVTAVAEGTCTITATAEDGETKATASVTVFEGEEEDPNKPGTGDNDPEKPGTGEDNKGDGKKNGCGGNVAATSAMAGAVLLLGVTAIFVARKKAENK